MEMLLPSNDDDAVVTLEDSMIPFMRGILSHTVSSVSLVFCESRATGFLPSRFRRDGGSMNAFAVSKGTETARSSFETILGRLMRYLPIVSISEEAHQIVTRV